MLVEYAKARLHFYRQVTFAAAVLIVLGIGAVVVRYIVAIPASDGYSFPISLAVGLACAVPGAFILAVSLISGRRIQAALRQQRGAGSDPNDK